MRNALACTYSSKNTQRLRISKTIRNKLESLSVECYYRLNPLWNGSPPYEELGRTEPDSERACTLMYATRRLFGVA